MTSTEITNTQDYIDSRDVEERITELKKLIKESKQAKEPITYRTDELAELESLLKLKEQYVNDYGDSSWGFGAQFIRDSYFEDYAQELADDIGAIDSKQHWPTYHIDWEAAADELRMDYSEVDFDGVTYQTREA